jgi:hypothetical protein
MDDRGLMPGKGLDFSLPYRILADCDRLDSLSTGISFYMGKMAEALSISLPAGTKVPLLLHSSSKFGT